MNLLRFVSVAICLWLTALCSGAEPPARPNLSGIVTDDSGKPVEGAMVYIWIAAVKDGYSTFCPSCYPDCGKRAETNDKGEFQIESLDPKLLFEVMVAKEGCAPTSTAQIDPLGQTPPRIRVSPRPPLPEDPRQLISGIVVDMDGKPVPHALVKPEGITWQTPQYGLVTTMGQVDGIDKFTLTNSKGEFTLAFAQSPVKQWNLRIEARGFAATLVRDITTAEATKGLKIGPGATVHGRLMRNGKPVSDALMSISHADRTGLRYLGSEYIGTDSEGRFVFANVPIAKVTPPRRNEYVPPSDPPQNAWWLAVSPDSVEQNVSAPPKMILVSQHDQEIDVGDIALIDALHFKGRVVLSDGKPVPDGSRIYAGLYASSEAVQRFISSDGTFDLGGLHPNDWLISVALPGYGISSANPNHFGDGLQGRLDKSIEEFVIVLDPNVEPVFTETEPPYKPFKCIDPATLPRAGSAK